jgi:ribonucleoside-diphosphate reductase alpha chain
MGKIAKAAWECADPGIQYDDTINDWHTNPETGRITASNPCSEYMSLDNSSCNLASLNLLKFLRDDDTFDAEKFQGRRARHHGDGHLDLLRRLPDRGDR